MVPAGTDASATRHRPGTTVGFAALRVKSPRTTQQSVYFPCVRGSVRGWQLWTSAPTGPVPRSGRLRPAEQLTGRPFDCLDCHDCHRPDWTRPATWTAPTGEAVPGHPTHRGMVTPALAMHT